MPSTELQPPFDAYRGSGPYIFISYAHADAAVVFPDLLLIRALGASVWFDEGIDPGNEWPEDIARAIDRCALFVFFISRTSVSSRNCRNEVYFALTRDKPVVAIYLEETMVPRGIALSLSSTQAIMKFRMDADSYVRGLRKIIATISSPNMPSSTNAASAAGSLVPITGESPGGRAPLLWTKSSHTPRWIHHLYFCKMSAVEVTVTGILDKKVTLLGRHFLGIHDYVHLGESLPKIKK
ncbi:MAG: toll/interleukin-1 receptor domain-containing protein, partial [Gammaproteobacteria bacterium]|nr:toll/interleukin-1 receptor domain-containing protein [Gammaproteobacteria bacterium]